MMVPLEIKDDLLTQAETAAKLQGISFREFVAAALQSAIVRARFSPPAPFVQKVHDFGTHLESPWSLLSDLETTAAVMMRK